MADPSRKSSATLNVGGLAFPLMGTPTWTLRAGTGPSQEVFEVVRKDGKRLMEKVAGKVSVSLTITPEGAGSAGPLTVNDLLVVDTVPSGRPHTVGVLVADRRWLWHKTHVLRRYNVRRRTGSSRLLTEDALGSVGAVAQDIGFAQWSLRFGTQVWKASQILEDVFKRVDSTGELMASLDKTAWDDIQITDLEIDDPGDSAIARVLSYMNGIGVFVDKDGGVRLYSMLNGSEKSLLGIDDSGTIKVSPFTPAIVVGQGSPEWVDHRVQRPRSVRVYFNREIEVRFDRSEGLAVTQALGATGADFLENVLPSPDLTITIDGKSVTRGTWITVEDALAAWAASTPAGLPVLTTDLLLSRWMSDYFSMYALLGNQQFDPIWGARISVLKQHFRRTYRIPREWMDRIYGLRAYRVAIFDEETGQPSPSPVWMDYTLVFDRMRPLFATATDARRQVRLPYDLSVRGYANRITNGNAAPVRVDVVDDELGIIAISFRGDPLQAVVDLQPGVLLRAAHGNIATGDAPRFRTEKMPNGNAVAMDEQFGLATILTVAFGAPNNEGQLQSIVVTPQQAEAKVKGAKFTPAVGPETDMRISAQTMTAKFAWRDVAGMGGRVRQAIGIDDASGTTVRGFELVNEWINKKECEEVALAYVASYYASLQDRAAGSRTMGMSPPMKPTGAVDAIVHVLNGDGSATTTVSAPAYPPAQIDPMTLLPAGVRRMIRREVFP